MQILVVSDTHGRWGALYNVVQANPAAKTIIHLGDGSSDLERIRPEFPDRTMVGAIGNCDYSFGSGTVSSGIITMEDVNIFFTHGHNYRVKSGEAYVEQAARARNAQICLYGHTHIPKTDLRDGLYIMNPGSLGYPRDDIPTYGIIDISNGETSMHIVRYAG